MMLWSASIGWANNLVFRFDLAVTFSRGGKGFE